MLVKLTICRDLGSVVAVAIGCLLCLSNNMKWDCFGAGPVAAVPRMSFTFSLFLVILQVVFRHILGGLGQIFSSSNQRLIAAPLRLLCFGGFVAMLEFGNDKWLPVLLAIIYSCVHTGQELADTDNKCCVCVEAEPNPSDDEMMLMDKSVLQRSVGMVESTQSPTG